MDLTSIVVPFLVVLPALVYLLARYASPSVPPGEPSVRGLYPFKYLWFRWLLFWSNRGALSLSQRVTSFDKMVAKAEELTRFELGTTPGDKQQGSRNLYINGSNTTGDCYIVLSVTHEPHKNHREVAFLLRVPGVGDLVLPQHPDTVISNVSTAGEWSNGAGLKCTVLEPLRTWRISYNGLCRVGLREPIPTDECDERPLVHVRCILLWSDFTSSFDYSTDVHPCLAAANLARLTGLTTGELLGRNQDGFHYEQFGMLHGTVQVEGHDEMTVVMRGVKSLSGGVEHRLQKQITNYIVLENGTCLHVGAQQGAEQTTSEFSGCMFKPNGAIYPAVSVQFSTRHLLHEKTNEPAKTFTCKLHFQNNFVVEIQAETSDRLCLKGREGMEVSEIPTEYNVDGVKGCGFLRTIVRSTGHSSEPTRQDDDVQVYKEPGNPSTVDLESYVLPLDVPSCRVSSLTGGKGSQLAMLVELKKRKAVEFEVSNGFCITTIAFNHHLKRNEQLQSAVKALNEVSCGIREGDLKEACDSTVAVFSKTEIATEMKAVISRQFNEMFGNVQVGKSYAVRSSAVGEDTPQISAAGQMETFLGMNTMDKIFQAVQDCWASQFSFQAVQYKRQYGQSVESSMAVVVQEVVPAKSAGVVFSRDPITGNPSQIVINANFGLGESVVAGISEADTITLNVDSKKCLTISDKKIGRKEEAIFVAEQGGTKVVSLSSEDSRSCALSGDVCLKLGRIALMLDEWFGGGRDIEYAVVGELVYLLQARAITTFDVPSHYELLHEFDTGLSTDRMLVTTANIQEMCPGSVTPLTLSHFFKETDLSFQLNQFTLGRPMVMPTCKVLCYFYNQGFFNLTDLICFTTRASIFPQKDMGPAVCGQELDEDDTLESKRIISDHIPVSRWQAHLNSFKYLKNLWTSQSAMERLGKEALRRLQVDWSTAQQQYDDIITVATSSEMCRIWSYHLSESTKVTISRNVIMEILKRVSIDVNIDSETAMLLTSCPGVESADVPLAMERLAKAIVQEGMAESFQTMTSQQALDWIQSPSSGSAGEVFQDFLKMHGHRCIKEIEMRERSWGMDPIQTMPVLQAILASGSLTPSANKKYLSAEDAVSRLEVPLTGISKTLMIKVFVPWARKCVSYREKSKSLAIRVNHQRKLAYWRLARLMVTEGRLPDEDLLFFFTPTEIGQLLKDRSPILVARALRRRRILPEQTAMRFPLIFNGIPQPIPEYDETDSSEMQLKGMPISPGAVKGTSRVVTSLQDASSIQQGDILVTRITDIGWTPYFPLIKGLVTEIGGLMSHGAVVAREYGIPCVVNVQRATNVFHSGDCVFLDGGKGTIDKIKSQ